MGLLLLLLLSHFSHVQLCVTPLQEIGFIKFSPENIYLKACSAHSPRAQKASFLISALDSFQKLLKVGDCSG